MCVCTGTIAARENYVGAADRVAGMCVCVCVCIKCKKSYLILFICEESCFFFVYHTKRGGDCFLRECYRLSVARGAREL